MRWRVLSKQWSWWVPRRTKPSARTIGGAALSRYQITLNRRPGSLLDFVPLQDVALAYVQSLEALCDVRLESASERQVVISFLWSKVGSRDIPQDKLDYYGLERAG